MTRMAYKKELVFAKDLALKAGQIMKDNFSFSIDAKWKEDDTPLTIADTAINELVIMSVKETFPDDGVLGEEDSYEAGRSRLWVVDPIDGTMPFSQGIPTSAFSLALVVDGVPVVAAVEDPFTERTYSAVRDQGAYVNDRPIRVNDQAELGPKVFIQLDGRNDLNEHNSFRILDELSKQNTRLLKNFCVVSNSLSVARGNFGASIALIEFPWDGAAVSLLVTEAGGKATDLNGRVRRWDENGDGFIVSNGVLHEQLVEIISKVKKARD